MATDPCRVCGSDVRIVTQDLPRRLGESKAGTTDVRICTDLSCRTNTSARRLADTV